MEPDGGTTNIRNVKCKHWTRWLGRNALRGRTQRFWNGYAWRMRRVRIAADQVRLFRCLDRETWMLNELDDLDVGFRVLVDVALRSPEICMPGQDLNVPQ